MRFVNENLPFPLVSKEANVDRLYRTVMFPTEEDMLIRIKAVDINNKEISTLNQKRVNLQIPASEFDPEKHRYRIRAKLSMAIDGVKESHWVTQQHKNDLQAESFNHFRIRGVSHEGIRSDWVYSNIKNFQNEDILFQLLHDVLDIVLQTNDDHLEHLIETVMYDAMHLLYRDDKPDLQNERVSNEYIEAAITEIVRLLASDIHQGLKEKLTSSVQEFTEFLRAYKVMDRFEMENTDFIALLLEAFLDDQLDKIVEKANFEAILRNDEETAVLLQDEFLFGIRGSVKKVLYGMELKDHFVTTMNDAVKLISEPSVYEQVVYKSNETYFNLFRKMIEEIYLPLLVLDVHTAELETDIEDQTDIYTNDSLVEYDFLLDDGIHRHMLLYEVMELILEDADEQFKELTMDLLDHILTPPIERKLAIWMDYAPVEWIEFMYRIKERVQATNTTDKTSHGYAVVSQIHEELIEESTQRRSHFSHLFHSLMQELVDIINIYRDSDQKEALIAQVIDSFVQEAIQEDTVQQEKHVIASTDDIRFSYVKNKFMQKALQKVLFFDSAYAAPTITERDGSEVVQPGVEMDYFNVYKPNVKDSIHALKKDAWEGEVQPGLFDIYSLMQKDDYVDYLLGDYGGDVPLGVFRLGINTLSGKE